MKYLSIIAALIFLTSLDPGDDEKVLTRDQEIHIQNVFYHAMDYPDSALSTNEEVVVVVHFEVKESKMKILHIDTENEALKNHIMNEMENTEVRDDVPQGVEFAIPLRFKKE